MYAIPGTERAVIQMTGASHNILIKLISRVISAHCSTTCICIPEPVLTRKNEGNDFRIKVSSAFISSPEPLGSQDEHIGWP